VAALANPVAAESGPQPIVLELATMTRLHLAVKDADTTAGVRQPSGLAWRSDSKSLLVVNFNRVIQVDATTEAQQVSPVIGSATTNASIFDVAVGDKRYLYVENGALQVRTLK
jgi:hypothetical protein